MSQDWELEGEWCLSAAPVLAQHLLCLAKKVFPEEPALPEDLAGSPSQAEFPAPHTSDWPAQGSAGGQGPPRGMERLRNAGPRKDQEPCPWCWALSRGRRQGQGSRKWSSFLPLDLGSWGRSWTHSFLRKGAFTTGPQRSWERHAAGQPTQGPQGPQPRALPKLRPWDAHVPFGVDLWGRFVFGT